MIPKYAQDGAAIATVVAETGVTLTMSIIGAKYIPFWLLNRQNLIVILASIVMLIPCIIVRNYINNDTILIIIVPLMGSLIYGIIMYVTSNPVMVEMIGLVKNRVIKSGRNKY